MAQAPATGPLSTKSVFSSLSAHTYSGSFGDYNDFGHTPAMALDSGTISLGFSLDRLAGNYALISKDQTGKSAGDFTVWIKDGQIGVVLETATGSEYITVQDVILSSHTTYQFAFSFGDAGINIWLNGELVAAEPEFTQGLAGNTKDLVVGGTHAWNGADDDAHSLFKGKVSDVLVYDKQLGGDDMITLANAIKTGLGNQAQKAADMADLAPLFEQVDIASDTLIDILADYGVDQDGNLATKLNMMSNGRASKTMTGTDEADGIDGGRGEDVIKGEDGDDVLQGGYGNDKVWGGNGNDILDGGHGEDRLWGGNGDDLLISRTDGREGAIFYDPDRDEDDPLNELTNGKLYPDQPIPGDDVLTGGNGADIFYFQTLINAKERYIQKHTRDDGTINWAGVAGENDKLHDHWVDIMGHDVVTDFNRAEGDRLVIEGHTTQIASITYGDANSDGVMDHSVISLYSDQGSGGGAHNDDRLGTITVYGDLVKQSDIEHTSKPTYGIIDTIDDLKEAIKPIDVAKDTGPIKPPKDLQTADDLGLPKNLNPVLATAGSNEFSDQDRAALVFDHSTAIDLKAGTVALSFVTSKLGGYQALFSKDASGYGDGGHITAYVNPLGHLTVRLQDADSSQYLEVKHAIKPGEAYDIALSFGPTGTELYLNGARVAYDTDVKVNWDANTEALIVGAAGWNNNPGEANNINSYFNGTITDFMVFDKQLNSEQIFGTDARGDYAYFNANAWEYTYAWDGDGALVVSKDAQSVTLSDGIEFTRFKDMTVRVDDFQFGGKGNNEINGLDGSDVLIGRIGDDRLNGNDNDDLLFGGMGEDHLSGGDGRDILIGGAGIDRLYGDDDKDVLKGGDGDDVLYGGTGNDKFYGGNGDDYISGNAWNDKGTASNDMAFFNGDFGDFLFVTKSYFNSSRGEMVTELIVTDSADGGSDGFYEGKDILVDIDTLVFADQTVAFDDLL